ncbi:MAG: helix-turn-helix transcriptional regulator [Alphaproteobacteria bacterium]|nr:helix-turn-helix transcriptional regulator [Alphaproteobacteria bacterium]
MLALVGLHLAVAALDLLLVGGLISAPNRLLAATVIRIAFIYLVLTSIFRVFYDLFDIEFAPAATSSTNPDKVHAEDRLVVERIRNLLEHDRLYREMGLTRAALAQKLGISEQKASRIVNAYFRKNFSELINSFRVDEAKHRLVGEDTAITVIAFEVGFNSIGSFNRVFKELAGVSPSEFRALHKKNRQPGVPSLS